MIASHIWGAMKPSLQCLIMPGEEALDVADKSGLVINGDTVHWGAQAEGRLVDSLYRLANSGYLAVLHLSEHDRREWGTGDIGSRTKEIFTALRRAKYNGPVVLENFSPVLHSTLNIHRPNFRPDGTPKTPYEVLKAGAQYITEALS